MSSLDRSIRAHPLAWYLGTTYALAWGYWVPFVIAGRVVTVGGSVTQFPALLAPALAALLVTAVVDGRAGLHDLLGRMVRWRVPLRWWVIAIGSPLVLVVVALGLAALGGSGVQLGAFGQMAGLPQWGVLFVWGVFILAGIGEETGWRSFLYDRLRRDHGWRTTALLVAPCWAAWHLPLFFLLQSYRDLGPVGVPGFVIGLTCGSLVLGWLYESAVSSVLVVAVWHGTYNLTSATAAAHGTVAAVVSTGVSMAAVALVLLYRKGIGRPPAAAPAPLVASR